MPVKAPNTDLTSFSHTFQTDKVNECDARCTMLKGVNDVNEQSFSPLHPELAHTMVSTFCVNLIANQIAALSAMRHKCDGTSNG